MCVLPCTYAPTTARAHTSTLTQGHTGTRLCLVASVSALEAAAQMAYLSVHGHVDVCISEDTELLAFGCKRLMFSLEIDGRGREILLSEVLGEDPLAQFQAACVLMGCLQLPQLPGLGDACVRCTLRPETQEQRQRRRHTCAHSRVNSHRIAWQEGVSFSLVSSCVCLWPRLHDVAREKKDEENMDSNSGSCHL